MKSFTIFALDNITYTIENNKIKDIVPYNANEIKNISQRDMDMSPLASIIDILYQNISIPKPICIDNAPDFVCGLSRMPEGNLIIIVDLNKLNHYPKNMTSDNGTDNKIIILNVKDYKLGIIADKIITNEFNINNKSIEGFEKDQFCKEIILEGKSAIIFNVDIFNDKKILNLPEEFWVEYGQINNKIDKNRRENQRKEKNEEKNLYAEEKEIKKKKKEYKHEEWHIKELSNYSNNRISFSKTTTATITCGKCGKEFSFQYPFILNSLTDPLFVNNLIDFNYSITECSFCKFKGKNDILLLYHDPTQNYISFVVPSNFRENFIYINYLYNIYLNEYKNNIPLEFHTGIEKSSKYINLGIEQLIKKISPDKVHGYNHFEFMIYPNPTLEIIHDFQDTNISNFEFDDYDIVLKEGNYPDFVKDIWSVLGLIIENEKLHFQMSIYNPKEPTVTHGIPEIVLIIGSSVILPFVINILSSLFMELLKYKKSKEKESKMMDKLIELEKYNNLLINEIETIKNKINKIVDAIDYEDKLLISLIINKENKKIIFKGSMHEIQKEMTKKYSEILSSMVIPGGENHVLRYMDGKIIDPTLGQKGIGSTKAMKKRLLKIFNSKSRIKLLIPDDNEDDFRYKIAQIMISQSKVLIDEKKYSEAVEKLKSVLSMNINLPDLYFNLAFALEKSGENEESMYYYMEALLRLIRLPTLENIDSFLE